jgi:hypothetical protein
MDFVKASIVDHGSIARHTFTRAGADQGPYTCVGNPPATPPKDTNVCKQDCFGEYSCS